MSNRRPPSDQPEPVPEAVRDSVEVSLTETAVGMGEVVEKLYGPKWKAQSDLARLLISLSSAILALTATFREQLAIPAAPGLARSALLATWISMILCLLAAVIAVWLAVNRRTYPIRLQNLATVQGPKVFAALKRGDDPALELRDDLKKEASILNSYDRWSSHLLALSLVLFMAGVLALAVAGWPEASMASAGGHITNGS